MILMCINWLLLLGLYLFLVDLSRNTILCWFSSCTPIVYNPSPNISWQYLIIHLKKYYQGCVINNCATYPEALFTFLQDFPALDPRREPTGSDLYIENLFRLTLKQSKTLIYPTILHFVSSLAGYFKFISLPLVTTAKGWRSLLSHTELREMKKVSDSVCVCGRRCVFVCVHSRMSVWCGLHLY